MKRAARRCAGEHHFQNTRFRLSFAATTVAKTSRSAAATAAKGRLQTAFAAAVGLWLGVALLKFGNPVILDHLVEAPGNFEEILWQAWPVRWGYGLLAAVIGLGLAAMGWQWRRRPWWVWLPAAWWVWQGVASAQTVDAQLTGAVLKHFAACVGSFYLGLFLLSRVRELRWTWGLALAGFLWVIWVGLDQHFGGLEATRQYVRQQPNWQQLPPDYLQKLESNRIFSTLVYPNALAGAVLLWLPVGALSAWRLTGRLTTPTRGVVTGLVAAGALACLYWSGSKAGWLIALGLAATTALLRLKLSPRLKLGLVAVLVVGGLTAFFVKFAPYFRQGATSLGARFDYWSAAVRIARERPLWGSGPGTFSVLYRRIKAPEAEMARLAHNDYLEQASDSGLLGAVLYTTFIVGSLHRLRRGAEADAERFAVWLGLLGWSLQGLVEFGLYIPALAWPAFLFLGWLWGVAPPPDTSEAMPWSEGAERSPSSTPGIARSPKGQA